MAKILSQEEVDALLGGFSGEEADAPAQKESRPPLKKKEKNKNVSSFDFRRPDRVSGEQLRRLHCIHARFAGNFSSSLSAYLRTGIDVTLDSVSRLTYREFTRSLPDPAYYNTIAVEPLEGSALLVIGPGILFPLIDKILGGKGKDSGGPVRTLTRIEQTVIAGVVKLFLGDLEESWKPAVAAKMSVTAVETTPQLIRAAPPNEIGTVTVFELKIGGAKGFIKVYLPCTVQETVAGDFGRDGYTDRAKNSPETIKKIKGNLLKTRIRLEAGIYGGHIAVKDLLQLEKGQVIRLEAKADGEIHIQLNGVNKFTAYPVRRDRKKAVQIVNLIPADHVDHADHREFNNERS